MDSRASFGDYNYGSQVGINNGTVNNHLYHGRPTPERPETPPNPSAFIPFARDQDFVERGALLDEIHQKCVVSGSRTALVGLGGVGKSQLAIEYAYRTQERSPQTWVFWIYASSVARFEQSYRIIADRIKIFGRKDPKADIFKLVHDWMHDRKNGSWLLILDSLDDTHICPEAGGTVQAVQGTGAISGNSKPMTEDLPQSQNGSILITSRYKDIARNLVEEKNIIDVEPMAQAHALALFEKKLGSLADGDDTAELATALEYMPLAIAQSAAYIGQKAPRFSVRQYLEKFRKSDRQKTSLLNFEGGQLRRDRKAKNSIIITWQISFEHVQERWPSAANLLSLMSFFDRQGIPEFLVRNRAQTEGGCRSQGQSQLVQNTEREIGKESGEENMSDSSEDDRFEKDVQVLRDYSFISCVTNRTFEMHALVQLAMRKWLEARNQLEPWKQQFVKSLYSTFPLGKYENWARCQVLFPHAKSAIAHRRKTKESLNEWASLMYNAAHYTLSKGNAAEAVQLHKLALEVRKKNLGEEHKETLDSMGGLGLAYDSKGRWKKAEALQLQVLERRKRVLGVFHSSTLNSMNNLALVYSNQGCLKKAEELQLQVIQILKKFRCEDYPYTLTSINNLALIYSKQKRWKKAEEVQVQMTEMIKSVLGEEHPDTLLSINNLTAIYRGQGRLEKAEKLQKQVREIMRRVLGEEHPHTLLNVNNLILMYSDQGRWEKGEKLQAQVIETVKRVRGEEHPDTLIYINNLISMYLRRKGWKESEELLMQVLVPMTSVLGMKHPITLETMRNLALTWKMQGQSEKAIDWIHECERVHIRVLGNDHPDTKLISEIKARWNFDDSMDFLSSIKGLTVAEQKSKTEEYFAKVAKIKQKYYV